MIKDLEEKQLQVAYFLSRGNRSVEEKFTEFNICKVCAGVTTDMRNGWKDTSMKAWGMTCPILLLFGRRLLCLSCCSGM